MSGDQEGEDEVGYGKPPKAHRWKKGQSGNPKGRPKRKKLAQFRLHEALLEALNSTVVINEGGVRRTVIRAQAMALALINEASRGKLSAFRVVMEALDKVANTIEQQELIKFRDDMTLDEINAMYMKLIDMPPPEGYTRKYLE